MEVMEGSCFHLMARPHIFVNIIPNYLKPWPFLESSWKLTLLLISSCSVQSTGKSGTMSWSEASLSIDMLCSESGENAGASGVLQAEDGIGVAGERFITGRERRKASLCVSRHHILCSSDYG